MAALTADRETPVRQIGVLPPLPVKGSTIIYQGAMVSVDALGRAKPASDTASEAMVGVNVLKVDNSGGGDGAKTVDILAPVAAQFDAVETTRLVPGRILYVVDDHTVGDATGVNSVKAGICLQKISSSSVWIFIDPAATHL